MAKKVPQKVSKKSVVKKATAKKVPVKKESKPVAKKVKAQPIKAKPVKQKATAKKVEAKKSTSQKAPLKPMKKVSSAKPVAKKVETKKTSKKVEKVSVKKSEQKNAKKIVAVDSKVKVSVQKPKAKKTKKSASKTTVNIKISAEQKKPEVNISISKKQEDEILQTLSSIVTKPENSNFSIRDDRPSHHIAFTLDDLDAYFKNLGNNTVHPKIAKKDSKAVATKAQQGKRPAKGVVKLENKSEGVATLFDILGFNPAETPNFEKLEVKSVPKKWRKYYNMLVDLRAHHSEGVANRSEEVLKRSAKDDAGDLSTYGQHLADAGSGSFERDLAYNMISNQTEILAEIDAAIKRIKDGSYGICEVTGKPIPEARLNAIPFARYTKEGQEIHELEVKRLKATRQDDIFEMDIDSTSGSRKNDDEDSVVGE